MCSAKMDVAWEGRRTMVTLQWAECVHATRHRRPVGRSRTGRVGYRARRACVGLARTAFSLLLHTLRTSARLSANKAASALTLFWGHRLAHCIPISHSAYAAQRKRTEQVPTRLHARLALF